MPQDPIDYFVNIGSGNCMVPSEKWVPELFFNQSLWSNTPLLGHNQLGVNNSYIPYWKFPSKFISLTDRIDREKRKSC